MPNTYPRSGRNRFDTERDTLKIADRTNLFSPRFLITKIVPGQPTTKQELDVLPPDLAALLTTRPPDRVFLAGNLKLWIFTLETTTQPNPKK